MDKEVKELSEKQNQLFDTLKFMASNYEGYPEYPVIRSHLSSAIKNIQDIQNKIITYGNGVVKVSWHG